MTDGVAFREAVGTRDGGVGRTVSERRAAARGVLSRTSIAEEARTTAAAPAPSHLL
jgi:hypothetical protein